MFDTRYPFFSAYLKGEEAQLITSGHVSRMSNVSGLRDVVDVIRDTDIGAYLDGVLVQSFDELDEHLWLYFGECVRRMEWFRPVPADMLKVLKAYMLKYDVLNIKMAVKAISSGEPVGKIPIGVMHNHGLLDELSGAEDADSIIALVAKCQLDDYAMVLQQSQTVGGEEYGLMAGTRLDREYYRNLMSMTRGISDGALLAQAFGIMIDMKNLQVVMRAIIGSSGPEAAEYIISGGYLLSPETIRELLPLKLDDIPDHVEYLYRDVAREIVSSYDQINSIAVVEEIIEKHKFTLVREILSPRLLSPLMVAWYLITKEVEIRNLRLILKAIYDNMPVEGVKDYLVLTS